MTGLSELGGEFRLQGLIDARDRGADRTKRYVTRRERPLRVRADIAIEIADRVAEPDQTRLDIGGVLVGAELVDLYPDADDRARRGGLVGLVEIVALADLVIVIDSLVAAAAFEMPGFA